MLLILIYWITRNRQNKGINTMHFNEFKQQQQKDMLDYV